jgi:hypothetical protein
MKAHVIRAVALLCGMLLLTLANAQGFTDLGDAIRHPTNGCGGLIVLTPRPGTQFADPLGHAPGSVEPFFAKAARLNVRWQSTLACVSTGIKHQFVPAPPPADSNIQNTVYSYNWSGYEALNTAQYIQTGYQVPAVTLPVPGYDDGYGYYSSAWAGIGGADGSSELIQSGTTQNIDHYGTTDYYFWYEIVGGPDDTGSEQMFVNGPTAHPGDDAGPSRYGYRIPDRLNSASVTSLTEDACSS